jgi:ribonuclease VapC
LIAVHTSALIAILLGEAQGGDYRKALVRDTEPLMSAVTVVEARMVARKHGVLDELEELLARLPIAVVAVDEAAALRVANVQIKWGKGNHQAQLNICDCFSYDVARQFGCPLLFIGNDFGQTDIASALA